MKYLLIILALPYSFTTTCAQTFEHYVEIQIEFQDFYNIHTTTCFRDSSLLEVWMSPRNTDSLAVPVAVVTLDGRIVVPFHLSKYDYFFSDQSFIFYQTHDKIVGRYDREGSHYVYRDYVELLDVRNGKLLVRKRNNAVGLVTRWQSIIVPFDYFHAWRGIQDDGRILFSRGIETWEYDTSGELIRTGSL